MIFERHNVSHLAYETWSSSNNKCKKRLTPFGDCQCLEKKVGMNVEKNMIKTYKWEHPLDSKATFNA